MGVFVPHRIDSQAEQIQSLILIKTNIGGWFFDAFLRLEHNSKMKITDHPVQTGVAVSDHAFREPRELSIDVAMSECGTEIIPTQFAGSWCRSVMAYNVLVDMQLARIPVNVLTRLGLYKNMLVESISATDDFKTLFALRVTVVMRELIVAEVTTVKISEKAQLTGATKRGTLEPIVTDRSALRTLVVGGGHISDIFGGATQ